MRFHHAVKVIQRINRFKDAQNIRELNTLRSNAEEMVTTVNEMSLCTYKELKVMRGLIRVEYTLVSKALAEKAREAKRKKKVLEVARELEKAFDEHPAIQAMNTEPRSLELPTTFP